MDKLEFDNKTAISGGGGGGGGVGGIVEGKAAIARREC